MIIVIYVDKEAKNFIAHILIMQNKDQYQVINRNAHKDKYFDMIAWNFFDADKYSSHAIFKL